MSSNAIVIVGAGITGCATAYYITKLTAANNKKPILMIECAPEIAAHASGKAGGFLAKDWMHTPHELAFAKRSFELHKELASDLKGAETYGYRRVRAHSVNMVGGAPSVAADKASSLPSWVGNHNSHDRSSSGQVKDMGVIGTEDTTAQCHPKLLCEALFRASGAQLITGKAVGLLWHDADKKDSVRGVEVQTTSGETIKVLGTHVVLAMGPWTHYVHANWGIPGVPEISGIKAHSVVFQTRPSEPLTPHCLFWNLEKKRTTKNKTKNMQLDKSWAEGLPDDWEVYPRPDGTVYVCGEAEYNFLVPEDAGSPLNNTPTSSEKVASAAIRSTMSISNDDILLRQACCLPVSKDSEPVIGQIAGLKNCFVATANGCWGILLGPASGLAIAEMIVHGKTVSVDIKEFDPARFMD